MKNHFLAGLLFVVSFTQIASAEDCLKFDSDSSDKRKLQITTGVIDHNNNSNIVLTFDTQNSGRDLTQPALLTDMVLAYHLKVPNGLKVLSEKDVEMPGANAAELLKKIAKIKIQNLMQCSRSFVYKYNPTDQKGTEPFRNLLQKELELSKKIPAETGFFLNFAQMNIFDPLTAFDHQEKIGIQSTIRSNIFIREVAALYSGALLLKNLECPNTQCVWDHYLGLAKQGLTIALNPKNPTGRNNYRLIADDGVWKEGPGYLNFAYEVFGATLLIHKLSKEGNLLNDILIAKDPNDLSYRLEMRDAIARNLDWLYASQRHGGSWPSQNDGDQISNQKNEVLFFTFGILALNQEFAEIGSSPANLRKWCEMISRNQKNAIQLPSTDGNYFISTYLRSELPYVCSNFQLVGKESGSMIFPLGGQAYISRNNPNQKIDFQMFNEGAWWKNSGELYSVDTKNVRREEYEKDIARKFGISTSDSEILPRYDNHKRFNDTHVELSLDGFPMVIGPGKSGYLEEGYAYKEIADPNNYNLTQVTVNGVGIFPKTMFNSAQKVAEETISVSVKRPDLSAVNEDHRVIVMKSDLYDRRVLVLKNKVFIVWDRFNNGPAIAVSRVNLRGVGSSIPAGDDFFKKGVLFKSGEKFVNNNIGGSKKYDDGLSNLVNGAKLPDRFVRLAPFLGSGSATMTLSEEGKDSCADEAFDAESYPSSGMATPPNRDKFDYCLHTVARIGFKDGKNQYGTGFIVWPTASATDEVVTIARSPVSNTVTGPVSTMIFTITIDDVVHKVTIPFNQ